ncbi:MAG: 2-oxoglutarate dehydrogenase complex dihydrolipoyllysine-residue succinyltransferase [Parvularculaceae bacterium]
MSSEIRVPTLGESVTEATIGRWLKKVGDKVSADEPVVELETDKVSVEANAPAAGVLTEIAAEEGATVEVDALLGKIGEGDGSSDTPDTDKPANGEAQAASSGGAASGGGEEVELRVPEGGESVTEADVAEWLKKEGDAVKLDEPIVVLETDKASMDVGAPAAGVIKKVAAEEGATVEVGALLAVIEKGGAPAADAPKQDAPEKKSGSASTSSEGQAARSNGSDASSSALSPAARRVVEERGLDPSTIDGTGKDGRVTKGDALAAPASAEKAKPSSQAKAPRDTGPREERVKMTRLRQTIARRLKEAQDNAAMLTTFNDVDMTAVMDLRGQYKELFEKKHGIKLGFMSFFVKACVHALKEVPDVNAEIDGTDVIYKNYYDIGVAVGSDKGLVVPIVRDADIKSMAEIELEIADLGRRARDGDLSIAEMQGGTFTISNGGVYGSLLSTPILNPPQSGILGMHRIENRPVAQGDQVVVRPMMYLALSYDHRIVDGKGAVTFLVRVKENLEDPQRLLLDL